jgi:hypothetical protein
MYDHMKGRGMTDQDNANQETNGSEWIGIGIAMGVAIGVAIGTALDNLAMGIAIGMGMGIILGAVIMSTKQRNDQDDRPSRP